MGAALGIGKLFYYAKWYYTLTRLHSVNERKMNYARITIWKALKILQIIFCKVYSTNPVMPALLTQLSEIVKQGLKLRNPWWEHVVRIFLQLVKSCVVHSWFDAYFDDISNVTICENTLLISPWNDKIMGDFLMMTRQRKSQLYKKWRHTHFSRE